LRDRLRWAIVSSMLVNVFTSRARRAVRAGRAAGAVQWIGGPVVPGYTPRSISIEDGT